MRRYKRGQHVHRLGVPERSSRPGSQRGRVEGQPTAREDQKMGGEESAEGRGCRRP